MNLLREYWTLLHNRKFLHATAVLIGTMVGVGIFGIPIAFAKAGFWVGTVFLVLIGAVTICIMLLFSEIVLRTHERHQLVGYANLYTGSFGQKVILFSNTLGIYGALLAYIVIAGKFLSNIFSYFFYTPAEQYSLAFFVLVAIILWLGIKTVEKVEFIMTSLFILVVLAIFALGVGHIDVLNFSGAIPEFWFLPYGVLLFAFSAITSIPIQREILRGQEQYLKKSIIFSTVVVGLLYLIFAFTVVGISGDVTSPDGLSGLFEFLGSKIIILGSMFGVLAITTSSLMLGTALLEVFQWDYKMKKWLAWILVMSPPLLLFLAGQRNFIDIISIVGAVAVGIEPPIFIWAYWRARKYGTRTPEYTVDYPSWFLVFLSVVFITGAIYAFFPS